MQFTSKLMANHERKDKSAERFSRNMKNKELQSANKTTDFCIDMNSSWLCWIQESQITIKTL